MTTALSPEAPHLAPPVMAEITDRVYACVRPPGGCCLDHAGLVVGGDARVLADTAAGEHRAHALRATVQRHLPDGATSPTAPTAMFRVLVVRGVLGGRVVPGVSG
ncbi:MBL fold metallo-hydrolase [Streptomyces sp. NPDC001222]|uniref:hypothetical protein n=1 Tax=Streptomyces sp. NPDC001222 TaxID=3364548 RepID=UPI0036A64EC8